MTRFVLCVGRKIPRADSLESLDAGLLIEWVKSVGDAEKRLRQGYDVLLLDSCGDRAAEAELASRVKVRAPETKVAWVCRNSEGAEVAGAVIRAATGGDLVAGLRHILGDS